MSTIDPTNVELGAIRLSLREELSFRVERFGGGPCYMVEDPARSRFFRLGLPEYTFLSLLDGRTTISEAVAGTASQTGIEAFTEMQAAAFCRWLVDNELASTEQSASANRLLEKSAQIQRGKRWERLNPIMLKIPLGNPQSLLTGFSRVVGWCFGGVGLALWLPAMCWGLWIVISQWGELANTSAVLSSDNWVWLGTTWFVIKFFHEAAHGVACRRFGGECREVGAVLLLFIPLPYVDVTSSWRFGSKWQRMIVAAAGLYAELFLAALAAICWSYSDSALVQHHAVNVMLTAGVVTLLFNLNPLMRFDGYYLLTDFLELPNLASHGQQDFWYLTRRWLVGITANRPRWPEGQGWVIRMYGFAAFAWRVMICLSLILAAEFLYHGAGVVLAATAVLLWIVLPLCRFLRYLVLGDRINPPHRLRFLLILSVFIAIGYGIWNHVPVVERIRFPAVVDYETVDSVRAGVSGFVQEVRVQPNDEVQKGQVLFVLENEQISARLTELELALKQSELQATRYHRQEQLAAYQLELEQQTALRKKWLELKKESEKQVITAPESGRLLSRNVAEWHGRWVAAGTELAQLGDHETRTVKFQFPQTEIKTIRRQINSPMNIHVWGSPGVLAAPIQMIPPRATVAVAQPRLTALANGPLPIKPASPSIASTDESQQQWELLEPHFTASLDVSTGQLAHLGIGQTAVVEFTTRRGVVGDVVRSQWQRFWNDRHEKFRQ